VCCVAVSSDEGLVAAGSSDNLIYVWDVATRNVQALQGHTGSVYAVSFSPDGKQLASGSKDTTVRRWDLTTYTEADVLDDHNGPVFSVTFAADNATIISGSEDQDVAIWNTRAWYIWDTRAYRQQKYHRHGVTAVINCTNGLLAASSDTNGTIQLWDASTSAFRHCATLRDPDQIPICCIVFSVDGKRLISGLTSGSIYLWDVHTREIHRRFTGHTDAINALEWPHGDKCFVSCSKDLTVRRWDTTTGQVVAVIRRQVVPVTDIVAFPDGRRFMTGSRDGRVHIFDRGKRTPLASRDLEPRRVKIVACSPDGALVAACSPDAILQIIDAHNGEVVAIFEGLEPDPTSLAFSPDSSQITMSYGNLSNDTWVAGYDFDRRAAAVHQSRGLVAFSCDDGGWIYYKRLVQGHEVRTRYCWIPPSHRWTTWSEQAAWAGNILAIGTDNGALSILDFELAWSEVS
jgi:WD40 repeat protein